MFKPSVLTAPALQKLVKIKEKYGSIAQQQVMFEAAKRGAVVAEANISEYPPQSGNPLPVIHERTSEAKKAYKTKEGVTIQPGQNFRSKFKSRKQQGAVFVQIKEGKVPYRRSGTLGRRWTSKVEKIPGGAVIHIGNNTEYAPEVVDEKQQAGYHRGTWTPIQEDMRRAIPAIKKVITKFIKDYLS